MGELQKLKNIGARTEKNLHEIGIFSVDEFFKIDSLEIWQKLRAKNPEKNTCICALWQIVGAKINLPWHKLPPKMCEKFLEKIKKLRKK